ncbi:uncharacterized protein LOC131641155 [Vicia villosa]|uniref:uncharacterized protein LOC131641155 n=1 Tax=Vicia villosa TaxID=3911 RepID=UPI00273CE342|nr:uncharacterized protein LOC131641155 [Vicia villosa]
MDANSIGPALLEMLKLDLQGVSVDHTRADSVAWIPDKEGNFSVKSCYGTLCRNHISFGPKGEFDKALILVWKVEAPMKSKAFGWRCFINKIPTRGALYRKGIILFPNSVCAFCRCSEEDSANLLLTCFCVDLVWREIVEWIGFVNYKAVEIKDSFLWWYKFGRKARVRKGKEGVVWLAVFGIFG